MDPEIVESWSRGFSGDVFVDVGACRGQYTMRRASAFRMTYALEPNPLIASSLRRTVERAGLTERVRVLELAAAGAPGRIRLYRHGEELDSSLSVHPIRGARATKFFTVQAVEVDDLLDEGGQLDFLKIDTEGGDLPALLGARKVIERDRPHVQVEIHRTADFAKVREVLEGWGYRIKLIAPAANCGWIFGSPVH